MRGIEVGFNFAFGMFEKACVQDLLHFKCNPTGEQVNVGNPCVGKKEKSLSVNLQMKPLSIMQFHLICSQNEPMSVFLQTRREGAVLRFVNNLINVLFIISACITDKHLAPTPLQHGAGKPWCGFICSQIYCKCKSHQPL